MTTKTKMSNLEAFQELSIQIACLDMKLNKILELLNTPEIKFEAPEVIVNVPESFTVQGAIDLVKEHMHKSLSDNEKFDGDFK